jgi:molybdopterin-guanine dinucleotide biosynthesis protein A
METRVNAIILAGGRNTRMEGLDKAFLEIEGRPFIEIIIDRLKDLVSEIIVVTNSPKRYSKFKVKLVSDEEAGRGPLMGIYCGLKASDARYNFVVACDMPFINSRLIKFMLDNKDNCDILLFKDSEKFHTLFGVYSKSCIPVIEEMLSQNCLRIQAIFPRLKSRFLPIKKMDKFDPLRLSVVNINTMQELRKSRQMTGKKEL